jgi:hypothetical protein
MPNRISELLAQIRSCWLAQTVHHRSRRLTEFQAMGNWWSTENWPGTRGARK